MSTTTKNIGIIGGGILGMALALRLRERNFGVALVESAESLGGLAAPCAIGSYTWDRFYHVILRSDRHLLRLLDQLRLSGQIRWGKAKTGLLMGGRLYSLSNISELITFPLLTLVDKIRLGLTIITALRTSSLESLQKIRATDWLRSHSGQNAFDKIWLPLLKSKLGENYKYASASFITAIIARLYGGRRPGLKEEQFGYVPGGYKTILARFQQVLEEKGVHIFCSAPVQHVSRQNGSLQISVAGHARRSLEVDAVVLTVDSPELLEICPTLSQSEKERLRKVSYQSLICAAFILKKSLAQYYITNITDNRVPFTGVIEMSNLVDKSYFGGNALVYLPRYLARKDPLWKQSNEAIVEKFVSALESLYPAFRRDDILAFKVSRVRHALPIATMNYTEDCLFETKTSLENLFVVNSAQISKGTLNVNEILGLANNKSSEIA